MSRKFKTFGGCCDNHEDSEKLDELIGVAEYEVLYEDFDASEGYGHHQGNAVLRLADGRYVHVECGGCSCEGSGSWVLCATREKALQHIPMDAQERLGLR